MTDTRRPKPLDYYRYIEGELSQSDAQALEREIAENKDAQTSFRAARRVVELLATSEPDLPSEEILTTTRTMIRQARTAAERPPGWVRRAFAARSRIIAWPSSVAAATAATAVIIWSLGVTPPLPPAAQQPSPTAAWSSEWRLKSTGSTSLAGVDIHRQTLQGGTERVRERIYDDDRLLFAYRNLGDEPFLHLMVFAVSPTHEVYWYYPAYTDPKTDPASISVLSGDSLIELPDSIRHDLTAGSLAIYALFSHRALRVSQVEKRAAEAWHDGQAHPLQLPPSLSGALQQVRVVDVQ